MPKYIFVYLGGRQPESPEEGKQHFEKYQQWLSNLADKVVSPAIPFKDTHTIHSNRSAEAGTTTLISGMSILEFASMTEALEAAQACPFLEIDGTLEVSEMVEMPSKLN